jgi:hypothetical protein
MTARFRRVAVFVGAAALAAGAGVGVAASQGDATDRSSGTPTGIQQGAPNGGGPDLSALASKLGVSTSALQKAMQATRPSSGSSSSPQEMAAALAKELGISEAKVRSAMQSVGPPSGTPPSGGNGSMPGAPSSGTTTSSS